MRPARFPLSALLLLTLLPLPVQARDDARERVRIANEAAPSFVEVRYYVRKDLEAEREPDRYDSDRIFYQAIADEKKYIVSSGLVIDHGRAIVVDPGLDVKHLDHIEIVPMNGTPIAAEISALYLNVPALLISFDPSTPDVSAIQFDSAPVPVFGDVLLGARLQRIGEEWRMSLLDFQPGPAFGEFNTCKECYYWSQAADTASGGLAGLDSTLDRFSRGPALIFAANGKALGVALAERFDLAQREVTWRGPDLLASPTIPWSAYQEEKLRLEEEFEFLFAQVRIEFRQDGESARLYDSLYDLGTDSRDAYFYGIPIERRRILVPHFLSRTRARDIDQILVTYGDKTVPGRFLGEFMDYGLFIVEIDEGQFPVIPDFTAPGPPARIGPYLALNVEHRYGKKTAEIFYNRNAGTVRGYKNRLSPVPLRPLHEGTLLLDLEGRIGGIYARIRREGEEEKRIGERYSYSADWGDSKAEIIPFTDLTTLLSDPDNFFDPNIQQMTKEEAKRRVWIGVEFSRMTPDLARFLKVEKPTKNGQIGMIINTVYAGSPAANLGIKVGDILLKIKRKDQTEPTELSPPSTYDYGGYPLGESLLTSDASIDYDWLMPPPWRDRANYLTELLAAIGEGQTITLTYWNGAEERTVDVPVSQAPVDFTSAPKYRDLQSGLTVKDLTYEVRNALQLPSDRAGVVVSRVDPGSPVAVASVRPYELVLEIDGEPVPDVESMQTILTRLRRAGETEARLTVWSLGRTRFADMALDGSGGDNNYPDLPDEHFVTPERGRGR